MNEMYLIACCIGIFDGNPFTRVVFYLGILWYPIWSKIISSFWGIVLYIRNIILLGLAIKKTHSPAALKCFRTSFLQCFQSSQPAATYALVRNVARFRGLGFRGLGFRVANCS